MEIFDEARLVNVTAGVAMRLMLFWLLFQWTM
jgi:hypothetical protein